jgi:hypothetical protein
MHTSGVPGVLLSKSPNQVFQDRSTNLPVRSDWFRSLRGIDNSSNNCFNTGRHGKLVNQ